MKRKFEFTKSKILLFVVSIALFACSNETALDSPLDNENITDLNSKASLKKTADTRLHFNAHLKGSNEVPANDSKATGQVIVSINKEETMIHYKLITANIENVRFSHFHLAPAGVNGGVVVTLYSNPNPQPSGPANGVLAEGDITEANITGALANNMAGLISAIRSGNIYVNVHTLEIGSGELRGQL
jgi:hypothetical protein